MSDQTRSTVTISVDLKKYRIRIFKALIHQMGDAKYVQLLVNPEEMAVALVFAEKESSGDQTHRLSLSTLASDNSVEIYSRARLPPEVVSKVLLWSKQRRPPFPQFYAIQGM